MAKDPAMLWYWNDWYSGTVLMSRFLKGCYMDLLHAQFNHGRLSLEEIKSVLGADFGTAWPSLSKKFAVDETGKYFNVRCEQEKIRRAEYVKSRSNGKSGRKKSYEKSYDNHMNNHTENENENRNEFIEKGVQGEKHSEKPIGHFMQQKFMAENPGYAQNLAKDSNAILVFADYISQTKGNGSKFPNYSPDDKNIILHEWGRISGWYRSTAQTKSLDTLSKFKIQEIFNELNNGKITRKNSGRFEFTGQGGY